MIKQILTKFADNVTVMNGLYVSQYCFLKEQKEEDKALKRKQIVALLLSSVIAVSSCLPVSVQAYAAEDASASAEVETDSALE